MKEKLAQAFAHLADSIIAAVPKITVGLSLAIGALLVAKLLEKGMRYSLTKLRFDALVGKVGVDGALQRLGIRHELTVLIPRIAYFLVLFLLARTAVSSAQKTVSIGQFEETVR